ncbi:MAG TPA: UDP-glucose/GDP-mannose dehydrogenase family protein [Acidimicrobiales bacterium]|nr:UDP-glucose/GDP-mannose dehydrogenase family protein [Acidimicrobiales bacterium]
MPERRIAVIGSGYVGTVVAACLAHVGHRVVGVESDETKLGTLRRGSVPFHEPGLQQLLATAVRDGSLRFTDDFADAMASSDVVFVCVGTPPCEDGQPDLGAMSCVAVELARNLHHYHVIVTKSTVPIGTGFWLRSLIEGELGSETCGALFDVVSNPEFLREGNAVQDYLHPDRLVLGSTSNSALREVVDVYRPILEQRLPGLVGRRDPVPVLLTGLATAEMTKYASNAFLATKISFANEMARLCELVGADVTEVTAGMGLDSRIGGRFLDSGLGWGGSCFGKDLRALVGTAEEYGYHARVLEAAIEVNEGQRQLAVEQLLRQLKTLRGARVGILGLSFKPDTDDLRDSPALDVACRLVRRGSFVTAYDPMVRSLPGLDEVRIAPDAYSVAAGADAVVVATEWPEFLDLDLERMHGLMRGDVFLDGRNLFDPAKLRAAGFRHVGIGRPAEAVGPASAARLLPLPLAVS